MNIRKQLKAGKKTTSMTSKKPKGLKVANRIKAIRNMKVPKRLRRGLTTATSDAPASRMGITTVKWIAIVRKKISASRPKFPRYYTNYSNKRRNGSNHTSTNKNMIIIHNNTSITGNEELDNRTSCVEEAKDVTPLALDIREDDSTPADSASLAPPDWPTEEDSEIIRLGEEKAAIHIQSVFRGHLARRACRALKSLVRLQAMVRGVCVRRQARIALDCMNALVRLQFRVRTRQFLINSPNNDTVDYPSLD